MNKAVKTLEAIATAMEADQGARYRTLLRELMPTAEDAYRGDEPPFRSHLGASVLGRECPREAWYTFHWTTDRKHEARLLRLFNRGHLEEPRMLALLIMIGCQVWYQDENGKQFRIYGHRGHFGGGMDAVALGVPDLPDQPILGEFKTHNDKSFKKVQADGVREAKWEHYVQMNLYMGYRQLPAALYVATNKNDDDLHAEIVYFDKIIFYRYVQRSIDVVDAASPPARISGKHGASDHRCKFCDHSATCHNKRPPAINCRTCHFAEVRDNGEWWCENKERQIKMLFPGDREKNPGMAWDGETYQLSKERQLVGCPLYVEHPEIRA